jgi:hypothetical protein
MPRTAPRHSDDWIAQRGLARLPNVNETFVATGQIDIAAVCWGTRRRRLAVTRPISRSGQVLGTTPPGSGR